MPPKSAMAVLIVIGLLTLPFITAADPPMSATVQFGQPDTGSPFPPVPEHDRSGHAKDRPVPRTVVISQGGTVEFHINTAAHGLAIYEPGTRPEDIDADVTTPAVMGCPTVPLIDDPAGRIAVFDQPCALGMATDVVSFTFNEPGRYLFICTFRPHFVDFEMYGWVNVE